MTKIAIALKTRGLGYVVEGGGEILDWAVKRWTSDRSMRRMVELLLTLIHLGDVQEVLLEDEEKKDDTYAKKFLDTLIPHLLGRGIKIVRVSKEAIQNILPYDNRYLRAAHLSRKYPFLLRYLGQKKRPWESERAAMLVFDAMGMMEVRLSE
jgi:hypothetical protein